MSIKQNLHQIEQQIEDATQKAQRTINSVTLLAVSKAQKINKIEEAFAAGQKLFGESYLSEALPKIDALKHLNIEWHFIGPIQSNKTRDIAEHFQWVQSVDRIKIARRLNEQRPDHLPPLQVTAQINLFQEHSKQGAALEQLDELLHFIDQQPKLCLRGLMSIPPRQSDPALQRQQFQTIQQVFQQSRAQLNQLDTLSMGMSDDMIAAIASGSTMVRIGTALFGARPDDWKQQVLGSKSLDSTNHR